MTNLDRTIEQLAIALGIDSRNIRTFRANIRAFGDMHNVSDENIRKLLHLLVIAYMESSEDEN